MVIVRTVQIHMPISSLHPGDTAVSHRTKSIGRRLCELFGAPASVVRTAWGHPIYTTTEASSMHVLTHVATTGRLTKIQTLDIG
eukprot:15327789-Ditylum_brightwellii.AAC.1